MRRVWAGLIVGVFAGTGGFAWGYLAHRDHIFPYDLALGLVAGGPLEAAPDLAGRWRKQDGRRPWMFHDEEAFTQDQLLALGYLQGTTAATDQVGVVRNEAGAFPGMNLATSGHAPEAVLLAMGGSEVHRWSKAFGEAFGELALDGASPRPYWRRARLLPDGGLVTMFVDQGTMRLDRDSNVVWTYTGGVHHDLRVVGDELWTLSRELRTRPLLDSEPMLDDEVLVLDLQTGAEIRRFAVYDAIEQSAFKSLLRNVGHRADRDYFHTNSIRVLDGALSEKIPAFEAGNILISLRNQDWVLVVDPRAESVVWAMTGPWSRQHEPSLLPNGNLLVFDNMGIWPRSRALEVNPATQQIAWTFDGGHAPLISETCGTAHRLENGNTLIIASDTGRAVEVTPDKRVVWEYFNPARAGEDGELVATLFDVQRLSGSALGVFAPEPALTQEPQPPLQTEP